MLPEGRFLVAVESGIVQDGLQGALQELEDVRIGAVPGACGRLGMAPSFRRKASTRVSAWASGGISYSSGRQSIWEMLSYSPPVSCPSWRRR